MADDVLSQRQLNRATLARQHLLERVTRPAVEVVRDLVGLQAQEPSNPHVALWSRVAGFDPAELDAALVDRVVVRTAVMRSTIHLVTADDCVVLRPLAQPVLEAELARHPEAGPAIAAVDDMDEVVDVARQLLAEAPRTMPELRAAFAERFPDVDPAGLAYACRNRLLLIQVPPRGLWGKSGGVRYATVEHWLGRSIDPNPSLDEVALRYFGAFGPATVADVTTWSGLTGMRAVVERLRPRLRSFRDERGRELFDLPDAPRPDPDVPAPVRLLPEYDNVLLSHADRSRFALDGPRPQAWTPSGPVKGSVLHDGSWVGSWRTERPDKKGPLTVVVDHDSSLKARARRAVETEASQLLRLYGGDDVRLVPIDA